MKLLPSTTPPHDKLTIFTSLNYAQLNKISSQIKDKCVLNHVHNNDMQKIERAQTLLYTIADGISNFGL